MDKRPIGVFDSGLGGLTAVRELRRLLPGEDIVYFGDTGLIRAENPAARVLARPCPLFVPLVEDGRFRPGDVVIETVAEEYLAPLKQAGVDTLVLGCTHYPLLIDVIRACMGPGVTLINAGAEGAKAAAAALAAADALAGRPAGGRDRYFVSDRQEDFSRLASIFLGWDVAETVGQVDIAAF